MKIQSWTIFVIALAGAGLMIFYGAAKVHDPEWLRRLEILNNLPQVEFLLGLWLPWFEIALGVLVVAGGRMGRGAMVSTGLLLFAFLPVLFYFLISGAVDCGCSGGGEPTILDHPAVGIARNVLLGSALLWAAGIRRQPLTSTGQ